MKPNQSLKNIDKRLFISDNEELMFYCFYMERKFKSGIILGQQRNLTPSNFSHLLEHGFSYDKIVLIERFLLIFGKEYMAF